MCSFCWNFTERQILWSLCSVDFHTLTLQLPIQTPHSVAPKLQVFVSSLENCKFQENEHTPGGKIDTPVPHCCMMVPPPHSRLMTPLPILSWWPPYPYLVDDPPTNTWLMTPPIVGWWPPYPYLADDPPTHTWLMTPLPILGWWPPYPYLAPPHSWLMTPLPILAWWPPLHGWMMCWVKLVLVLYVWRQNHMRPAQQGLPFIVCLDLKASATYNYRTE